MNSTISLSVAFFVTWTMIFPNAAITSSVPFLLWTNIRSEKCMPDVPLFPGENIVQLTGSDFFRCLSKRSPDNVFIFALDELDMSDFSVHASETDAPAFHRLQRMLKSSPSIIMPAVTASSVLPHMSASLKRSFSDAEVRVIELPNIERKDLHLLEKSVSQIDDLIQQNINQFPGSYISLLTAGSSPQVRLSHNEAAYASRRLLATEEEVLGNNSTFINGSCVYINIQKVALHYGESFPANLSFTEAKSAECNTNTSSIKLIFSADVDGSNVTLSLAFVNYLYPVSLMNWWNISAASITHGLINGSTTYNLSNLESFSAPIAWSWVCEAPEEMTWRGGERELQSLSFGTLQVQAFITNSSEFSRALDCSGFLTAPIWMGTVVAFIFAVIFAFGLAMIMKLSTMDRFDDPRGKSIIVQGHEAVN